MRSEGATRVCPNCSYELRDDERPVDNETPAVCPKCGTELPVDKEEALVDKEGADSFPASDPPSHFSADTDRRPRRSF